MAKSPLDLANEFSTPGIDAKKVRINEPQRDATRGNVAPNHKEKPLTKTTNVYGGNEEDRYFGFRDKLEKEFKDRFSKDPNAIISLSALKKQYGDNPEYSWNTLPGNHIVKDGETYYYGDNAADLDKRIADYNTPYEQKLIDRFDEFGYEDNYRDVYNSLIARDQRGGIDKDGNRVDNAFPYLYYGRNHIADKIRELKNDPRNATMSESDLLRTAIENAQIDFDDAPEIPFTKDEWRQAYDEGANGAKGMDDWDWGYESLWNKLAEEHPDWNESQIAEIANRYYDMTGWDHDDEYLYGSYRDDNDREYSRPAFKFRNKQTYDWNEYLKQNPDAELRDLLGEIFASGDSDVPELFDNAIQQALDNGSSYSYIAESIYDIDEDLLYYNYDYIYKNAFDEAIENAANNSYSYDDAKRYLERRYPWIWEDDADIDEKLEDWGLVSDDRINEILDEVIGNYDPSYNDYETLTDVADDIVDDIRNQYGIEVDSSFVEDWLEDYGFQIFDIDDFNEYLLNEASDYANADRSLYDIIEGYGSGRTPEDLWHSYLNYLTNKGGFQNIGYDDLSQFYGRDFARINAYSPDNIRSYYANEPEQDYGAYGRIPEELRVQIDEQPSWRAQVRKAKELVKNGSISLRDAIGYLTAYTSLWENGLLSARHAAILEDEWGKQ